MDKSIICIKCGNPVGVCEKENYIFVHACSKCNPDYWNKQFKKGGEEVSQQDVETYPLKRVKMINDVHEKAKDSKLHFP